MKSIITIIMGLIFLNLTVFHIWTTIIAFNEGGFLGGILTFILPVLSEIYWMVKVWGENDTYTTVAIISIISSIILGFLRD